MPPSPMPDTPQMSARLAVVIVSFGRRERHLHVPAQAGVQRQRRREAPRVLREAGKDVELAGAAAAAEVDVFVRLGIERGLAGDGNDAAGEQRIELARVGELRGGRALEVRRREQARRRIVASLSKPRSMPGVSCCESSHARPRNALPPMVMLWLPFCQFSVSSKVY